MVGSVMVAVCTAALIVTRTNTVSVVKERRNMQSYEAVEPEQPVNTINTISLQDIKVDSDAVSEALSSARSRSPAQTQGLQ